jgi:hypothetical protein
VSEHTTGKIKKTDLRKLKEMFLLLLLLLRVYVCEPIFRVVKERTHTHTYTNYRQISIILYWIRLIFATRALIYFPSPSQLKTAHGTLTKLQNGERRKKNKKKQKTPNLTIIDKILSRNNHNIYLFFNNNLICILYIEYTRARFSILPISSPSHS